MKFLSLAAAFGLAAVAQAHMQMIWPFPYRSKYNPNVPEAQVDYSMTSPLDASGSNYPCKGYHSDFGTAAGKSVVTWQAGQTYNWTVAGSATHGGGSCQVALSYDKGSSWKVLNSYVGNCPLQPTWNFELPADTPAGDAIFTWIWFNNIGNREMYQNCATITIESSAPKRKRSACKPADSEAPSGPVTYPSNAQGGAPAASAAPASSSASSPASSPAASTPAASTPAASTPASSSSSSTSFNSRPAPLVANVANGCGTIEGKDVLFPNPGPDVQMNSQGTAPPTGSCGSAQRRAMPLKV